MSRCQQTDSTRTVTVYVVRDASGEYVAEEGEYVSGRTPAASEAREFLVRAEAEVFCTRTTDRVLTRTVEE